MFILIHKLFGVSMSRYQKMLIFFIEAQLIYNVVLISAV